MNLSREVGVDCATDLHLAGPVKGYDGDVSLPLLHGGAVAVVPEMLVALSACRLPLAEALACCWNPSGCDLSTVLVVDSGVRLDAY
jgi:hypothetical protein